MARWNVNDYGVFFGDGLLLILIPYAPFHVQHIFHKCPSSIFFFLGFLFFSSLQKLPINFRSLRNVLYWVYFFHVQPAPFFMSFLYFFLTTRERIKYKFLSLNKLIQVDTRIFHFYILIKNNFFLCFFSSSFSSFFMFQYYPAQVIKVSLFHRIGNEFLIKNLSSYKKVSLLIFLESLLGFVGFFVL